MRVKAMVTRRDEFGRAGDGWALTSVANHLSRPTTKQTAKAPIRAFAYARDINLWFCNRYQLARPEINRHRNMFHRNQPVAVDLSISIGNAYPPVYRMSLRVSACHMLKTVPESHLAVNNDTQLGNLNFRLALVMCEHFFPGRPVGVGAAIFLSWYHIEKNKAFVGYIVLHDLIHISGVESGGKSVH